MTFKTHRSENFLGHLDRETEALQKSGLFKTEHGITSPQQVELTIQDEKNCINLCANNYLGLANNPEVAAQIKLEILTPPGNKRFSDCIQLPDLGDNPDDQTILQYALGREQAAMDQYNSLADTAPEGPLKDVFTFLAQEETEHKNELEKIYYEVVHSGGV